MAESSSNSVLVIGAGMAGLTAARLLAEAGRDATVLEAAPRVGGRIHTLPDGPEVVELGAEFLHGRAPELWSLVKEAGLETCELSGHDFCFNSGQLEPCEEDTPTRLLDQLKSYTGPDQTLAEYLKQHLLPEERCQSAINFVEGFNAADHRLISVASLGLQQAAEKAIEGDRLFRVPAGYDRLPIFSPRGLLLPVAVSLPTPALSASNGRAIVFASSPATMARREFSMWRRRSLLCRLASYSGDL